MIKIVSIIIIGFLISYSFGVQGVIFEKPTDIKTTTDFGDIFFDLKMEVFMKLAKFPSISACIIDGNNVIWSNSYGFYDLENKKRATENTIYNVAHISCSVTGTALMQLYDQGLFDLDEDVNNYLPFTLRNPHFPDNPITFRMLLSQTSSLRDDILINDRFGRSIAYDWINMAGDPPFSFFPMPWLEDHLIPDGDAYNPTLWSSMYKPGEYSWYAHLNFALIAYLVERISGEVFIDYCKNYIFKPLEMYNTSFNLSELDIDQVAIPYHYYKQQQEYLNINEISIDGNIHPSLYWRILNYPAGGLYSTVSDLSHFLIAHVNDGVYKGVRILNSETIEEMHRIQPPGNFNDMIAAYYGLAWLFKINPLFFNITLMGHYGLNLGVASIMYHIPTEDIRVIFMANGDGLEGNTMAINLIEISLFVKGGVNLLSYIDFSKIGGRKI
jgi:CubicO group peptidase (beta-lactamase class C family)